jgi:hypothetical protein
LADYEAALAIGTDDDESWKYRIEAVRQKIEEEKAARRNSAISESVARLKSAIDELTWKALLSIISRN